MKKGVIIGLIVFVLLFIYVATEDTDISTDENIGTSSSSSSIPERNLSSSTTTPDTKDAKKTVTSFFDALCDGDVDKALTYCNKDSQAWERISPTTKDKMIELMASELFLDEKTQESFKKNKSVLTTVTVLYELLFKDYQIIEEISSQNDMVQYKVEANRMAEEIADRLGDIWDEALNTYYNENQAEATKIYEEKGTEGLLEAVFKKEGKEIAKKNKELAKTYDNYVQKLYNITVSKIDGKWKLTEFIREDNLSDNNSNGNMSSSSIPEKTLSSNSTAVEAKEILTNFFDALCNGDVEKALTFCNEKSQAWNNISQVTKDKMVDLMDTELFSGSGTLNSLKTNHSFILTVNALHKTHYKQNYQIMESSNSQSNVVEYKVSLTHKTEEPFEQLTNIVDRVLSFYYNNYPTETNKIYEEKGIDGLLTDCFDKAGLEIAVVYLENNSNYIEMVYDIAVSKINDKWEITEFVRDDSISNNNSNGNISSIQNSSYGQENSSPGNDIMDLSEFSVLCEGGGYRLVAKQEESVKGVTVYVGVLDANSNWVIPLSFDTYLNPGGVLTHNSMMGSSPGYSFDTNSMDFETVCEHISSEMEWAGDDIFVYRTHYTTAYGTYCEGVNPVIFCVSTNTWKELECYYRASWPTYFIDGYFVACNLYDKNVLIINSKTGVQKTDIYCGDFTRLGQYSEGLFFAYDGFYNIDGDMVIDLTEYAGIIINAPSFSSNGTCELIAENQLGTAFKATIDLKGNFISEFAKTE